MNIGLKEKVEERKELNRRRIEEITQRIFSNKEEAVCVLNCVGKYIKDNGIKTDFDLKNNCWGIISPFNEKSRKAYIVLNEYLKLVA